LELAAGTLLAGRFRIEGPPLGSGASGVVYPARDEATGRAVVAKLLHSNLTDSTLTDSPAGSEASELGLARLQEEAALAGRLRHPRVIEVLGLWAHQSEDREGPSRWVLVSERFDGVALSEVGQLAPEAVVALGLEVCEGLQAAHDAGLVHGDVRPGNVLVGARGASLFDFGLGRLGQDDLLLRAGETAPERQDGGPPTVASDVYGLGLVLWQALHGRLPFSGRTPWAVIGEQRKGLPRPPFPWRFWEPRQPLVELCTRMLHPDPVERPDLGAVRVALQRARARPDGALQLGRPLPAFRPRSAWVIHGIDPGTGAPAVIAQDLSRRGAKRLLKRLREEGWQVRGTRQAFDAWDLLWILFLTLSSGLMLTPLVLPLVLVAAVRWRAEVVRPGICTALPPVSVPVPPRRAPPGAESAVVGGLLMLATALLLVWWPPLAALPALLLVMLVASSVRPPKAPAEQVARQGRVMSAFAELRTMLSTRALQLEDALGLEGELEQLEADWKGGRLDSDLVLVRVDSLRADVMQAPRLDAAKPEHVLDALRRGSAERARNLQ
jgi:hypothetical protein